MAKKGTKRRVPQLDPEFPVRLRKEMERTELSAPQLAKKANVTRQAIYRLTSSEEPPKNIEPLTLLGICGAMSTNPRWLATGEGPRLLLQLGDAALPLGHMAAQLLFFYQHMDSSAQDELLGTANRLYIKNHPGKSGANPFADVAANIRQIERITGSAPKPS